MPYRALTPGCGASGLWQSALNSREDYKPSQRFTLAPLVGFTLYGGGHLGYRYEVTDRVGLMLPVERTVPETGFRQPGGTRRHRRQLPVHEPRPERRAHQDHPATQLYGFVQWPLYRRVNGVQLTADWSAVVGVNARF